MPSNFLYIGKKLLKGPKFASIKLEKFLISEFVNGGMKKEENKETKFGTSQNHSINRDFL